MKKLIIVLSILTISACSERPEATCKFQAGDIVVPIIDNRLTGQIIRVSPAGNYAENTCRYDVRMQTSQSVTNKYLLDDPNAVTNQSLCVITRMKEFELLKKP